MMKFLDAVPSIRAFGPSVIAIKRAEVEVEESPSMQLNKIPAWDSHTRSWIISTQKQHGKSQKHIQLLT